MTIQQTIEQLIAASEKRLETLYKQKKDPETWAEFGYYIQQDIDAEIGYCNVLYEKLHRLQERIAQ